MVLHAHGLCIWLHNCNRMRMDAPGLWNWFAWLQATASAFFFYSKLLKIFFPAALMSACKWNYEKTVVHAPIFSMRKMKKDTFSLPFFITQNNQNYALKNICRTSYAWFCMRMVFAFDCITAIACARMRMVFGNGLHDCKQLHPHKNLKEMANFLKLFPRRPNDRM